MFKIDEDMILNENDIAMMQKIKEGYTYSIEVCFNKTFNETVNRTYGEDVKSRNFRRMIIEYNSKEERDFWFKKALEKLGL